MSETHVTVANEGVSSTRGVPERFVSGTQTESLINDPVRHSSY